jgi:hypothetical protein
MQSWKRMTYRGRTAVVLAAVLVVYTLLGFFVAPRIARTQLEARLPELLSRPVTVRDVSFNPLTLAVTVDGVEVREPDGDGVFVSFERLSVNAEWISLPRLTLVLDSIQLDAPFVHARLAGDKSNFSDLLEQGGAEDDSAPDTGDGAGFPLPLVVRSVALTDGTVVVDDALRGKTHRVEHLNLSVPLTSSLPKDRQHFIRPELSATINGKPLTMTGGTRPFAEDVSSRLVFSVTGAELPYYWEYVPVQTPVTLLRGTADCRIAVDFVLDEDGAPEYTVSGDVSLDDVSLVLPEGDTASASPREVLGLDALRVRLDEFNPQRELLAFGACSLTGLRADVVRRADGTLEAQDWLPGAASVDAPAEPAQQRAAVEPSVPSPDEASAEAVTPSEAPAPEAPADDKTSATPAGADGTAEKGVEVDVNEGAEAPAAPAPEADAAVAEETLDDEAKGAAPAASLDLPLRIQLTRLLLSGASIRYTDHALGGFAKTIGPLGIDIADVDTAPDHEATFSVTCGPEDGERLDIAGTMTPASLAHNGTLTLRGLDVTTYAPLYADAAPVDVASGVVDVSLAWAGDGNPDHLTLSDVATSVRTLALSVPESGEPLVSLPELTVTGTSVDVGRRDVHVSDVTVKGLETYLRRDADGLEVQRLLSAGAPPQEGAASVRGAGAEDEARDDAASSATQASAPQTPQTATTPWTVGIDRVALEDGAVHLHDTAPAEAVEVTVSGMDITVRGASSNVEEPVEVAFAATTWRQGRVNLTGKGTLAPLDLSGKVDLAGVTLEPLGGYLRDVMDGDLAQGRVDVSGAWGLSGDAAPGVRYDGAVRVSDVVLRDGASGKKVAGLKRFAVDGLSLTTAPFGVAVDAVTLEAPTADLVREADGRMNIARMLGQPAPEEEAPDSEAGAVAEAGSAETPDADVVAEALPEEAPEGASAELPEESAADAASSAAAPPLMRVDRLTLTGGGVSFHDETTSPAFATTVGDVSCQVTGFSRKEGASADVSLNATVDGYAPVTLTGSIVPFGQELDTNLVLHLDNAGLSGLSPYTVRYIAYPLSTGKLFATLETHIRGMEIAVDNQIRLANLTVGERVDNPDAPNLPIGLALSLLRDAQGNIDLDIPVRGRLDDPEFRLGKVVMKAIVNLFIKVVASPFTLIGNMFGGGEDVNLIAFEPGSVLLTPRAVAKLDAVAEAMNKRPGLTLEVSGASDADVDAPALAERVLADAVRLQKYIDLEKAGNAPRTVAEVQVTEEEYPQYLRRAYEAASFAEEKLFGGLWDPSVEDMEEEFRESVATDAEAVRELTQRRARSVRAYLLDTGGVPPERVFLKEGEETAAPKDAPASGGLVILGLR